MINYNLYARSRLLTFFVVNLLISLLLSSLDWDQSSQMLSLNTPRSAPRPAGKYNRNVNWTKYYLCLGEEMFEQNTDGHIETLEEIPLLICKAELPHWLTQVMAVVCPTWLHLAPALSWVLALLQWWCDSSQAGQICGSERGEITLSVWQFKLTIFGKPPHHHSLHWYFTMRF